MDDKEIKFTMSNQSYNTLANALSDPTGRRAHDQGYHHIISWGLGLHHTGLLEQTLRSLKLDFVMSCGLYPAFRTEEELNQALLKLSEGEGLWAEKARPYLIRKGLIKETDEKKK